MQPAQELTAFLYESLTVFAAGTAGARVHHHSLHRSGRHCHTPVLECNPVSADARRLQLCVFLRNLKDQKFPPASITHRGGYRALLLEHLPLFTPGKKYRVAMFLATSCTEITAYVFWSALILTPHPSSRPPQNVSSVTPPRPLRSHHISPRPQVPQVLHGRNQKPLSTGSSTWTLLVRA